MWEYGQESEWILSYQRSLKLMCIAMSSVCSCDDVIELARNGVLSQFCCMQMILYL